MNITQHVPNFVDKRGLEIKKFEFDTLDELFNIPFVKRWQEEENFHRWSLTDDNMLMVEQDSGKSWWVVGRINGKVELPMWHPNRPVKAVEKEIEPAQTLKMIEVFKIFQKSKITLTILCANIHGLWFVHNACASVGI